MKKYIVKNDEIDNFIDIIQSYYDKLRKKFDDHILCVMWMENELVVCKVSVPSKITYHQKMMSLTIPRKETACDYLNKYNQGCVIDEVDEIFTIFISDLKDITFSQYMPQPTSMLCTKLVGNFIEEDFGDFDYNCLPNCFRHINT